MTRKRLAAATIILSGFALPSAADQYADWDVISARHCTLANYDVASGTTIAVKSKPGLPHPQMAYITNPDWHSNPPGKWRYSDYDSTLSFASGTQVIEIDVTRSKEHRTALIIDDYGNTGLTDLRNGILRLTEDNEPLILMSREGEVIGEFNVKGFGAAMMAFDDCTG